MSDFISRLAARAVGQAAVAQPRPDVLLGDVEDEAVDVVTEAARPAAPEPAAVERETRTRVEVAAAPVVHVPASEPPPVHEQAAVHERVEATTASPQRERTVVSATERTHHVETHATERTTTELVATVAAAPVVAPPAVVVREATAAEHPVRVHIGRLEIRATVREEPPPPRRERKPRPEALSLGDYLRGGR